MHFPLNSFVEISSTRQVNRMTSFHQEPKKGQAKTLLSKRLLKHKKSHTNATNTPKIPAESTLNAQRKEVKID